MYRTQKNITAALGAIQSHLTEVAKDKIIHTDAVYPRNCLEFADQEVKALMKIKSFYNKNTKELDEIENQLKSAINHCYELQEKIDALQAENKNHEPLEDNPEIEQLSNSVFSCVSVIRENIKRVDENDNKRLAALSK